MQILKASKFLAINVSILFFLIEATSLTINFFSTHEFFYLRKNKIVDIEESIVQDIPKAHSVNFFWKLHPYFAYTIEPHRELKEYPFKNLRNIDFLTNFVRNNLGFVTTKKDPKHYPYFKKNSNEIIIGILGSSLPEQLFLYSSDLIIAGLKKSSRFKDKEITILSFANSGYKQPQALQLISYLLSIGQKIDILINLDGGSELGLGYEGEKIYNYSYRMPSHGLLSIVSGLNTPEDGLSTLKKKISYLEKVNQKQKILKFCTTQKFAFTWAVCTFTQKFYSNSIERSLNEIKMQAETIATQEQNYLYEISEKNKDDVLLQNITEMWANSSRLLHAMIKENGGTYYHFLQPNILYPMEKKMSEWEVKMTHDARDIYKYAMGTGFKYLKKYGEDHLKNKINYFDYTDTFSNITDTTFADSCCHYTALGYDIIAEKITNEILSQL